MLFNSIHYLLFFPFVVMAYFLLPHRLRNAMLLAASYYFYMCWRVEYILLIVASTLVDYIVGIQLDKTREARKRKAYLLTSLCLNLGMLFCFKYFNFLNDNIRDLFNMYNITYKVPALRVLLPVGISFYTFQTLSYTIDVYRGKMKAERSLPVFALYVAFFPQLVAGPIERSLNLLPQFYEKHVFCIKRASMGLQLMLWGFFQKIVIADRCALIVNEIYGNPESYNGFSLLMATYVFAFQIYCDFSGYSDIAIGSAQVLGFDLMKNFNRPYFSKSISEFWGRWHISLSTWFRDYLYIPLGGNRNGEWQTCRNLMVVFAVSGIWHGANWTFLAWGLLHGVYLLVGRLNKKLQTGRQHARWLSPGLAKLINVLITFHLVVIGWIFFRANSLSDAFLIGRKILSFWTYRLAFDVPDVSMEKQVLVFLSIAFLVAVQLFQRGGSVRLWLERRPRAVRWSIYYVLIMTIILAGEYKQITFIYFAF